jgi:hypothetical protein
MGGRATTGAALVFLGIIVSELRFGGERREAGKTEAIVEDEDISLAENDL